MSITVVGVNHRTAPLEVRERFAHAPHEVSASLTRVLIAGAEGGVLLSTSPTGSAPGSRPTRTRTRVGTATRCATSTGSRRASTR